MRMNFWLLSLFLAWALILFDNFSVDGFTIPLWKRAVGATPSGQHAKEKTLHYIVQLRSELTSKNVEDHLNQLRNVLRSQGYVGETTRTYNFGSNRFKGYSITLPLSVAKMLESSPQVAAIEIDRSVTIKSTLQQSSPPNWGLTRIWQNNVSFANNYRFWSSQGVAVNVFIVDSGIFTQHTTFQGRALEGVSFADYPSGDQNGHGTHVAGIVGGAEYGVAKGATLISVKVLDSNGVGTYSNIIAGLNWIYNFTQYSTRASVINMSVSGPASVPVNAAIEACVAAGIHVAVAAGNSATDACLSTPSSASGVVVAGAMNMYMQMSAFSNWGGCVSLLAPGEVIVSAGISSSNATRAMSGTSMSSPHVAGTMAMILSEVRMSPARMKRYLLAVFSRNLIMNMQNNTVNGLLFLNSTQISVSDILAVT